MSKIVVSQLNVYPIKSSAGISLSHSKIDAYGLAFDRRMVLTDVHGQFLTARTHPKLCLIKAQLTTDGLRLNAPNMPELTIQYATFSNHYQTIQIWQDQLNAQRTHIDYDRWFSAYLTSPCQLHYFGEQSKRLVKNRLEPVAFADGYPVLLISHASLIDLQQRCPNPLTMAQFRPNIVVENCLPFAEDGWQQIRIGAVLFDVVKPSSRCIFTTINPNTAELNTEQQPLATLKQYRQAANGEVMFGQNLVALNQGEIAVHDQVEIISSKPAAIYPEPPQQVILKTNIAQPKPTSIAQKLTISFHSWHKKIKGNNQQTLLEQGEAAGMILPYSCRAGMCGSCKMRLISGEVQQFASDGLSAQEQHDGYILACSCVPQTDVILSKD